MKIIPDNIWDTPPSVSLLEHWQAFCDVVYKYNRFGILDVRIFGSVARMEDRNNSDIDILYRKDRSVIPTGYLLSVPQFFAEDLMRAVGRTVDAVNEEGLLPDTKACILEDAMPLEEWKRRINASSIMAKSA